MSELQVGDARINYETWGEAGPWITLINGHNRPLNDFRLLARHLNALGFRALALDNRGSGLTKAPGEFTLADMAADVAALWAAAGIERTHVLGISMGGFIAQTLAGGAATKSRVDRLLLVSTAMRQAHIRHDATPWTADPAEVEVKLRPYFTAQFAGRNRPLIKGMAKQIAKAVAAGAFVEESKRQMRAVKGLDLSTEAAAIGAPTFILHGADDEIIPLAAADELKAHIPGATLEVFPAAGHLLLAEVPQALYAAVAKALGDGL